jgi:hypothetical protein
MFGETAGSADFHGEFMSWEQMTIGEYAAFETANGEKVTKHDGIWWRRVRPFFYQPAFPFLEIRPRERKPPPDALVGGCQHLVPHGAAANSFLKFFVFDEPEKYSLLDLKSNHRSNIKKGMKYFTIREVTNLQEFIATAYPIYLSFYSRTEYSYKKERREKDSFAQWAKTLFDFNKILILGAYHQDELSAVHISYCVEAVIILASFFSRTEALRLRVADVVMHSLRERAANQPGVKSIFLGMVTGQKGLDESKSGRGCKIVSRPAFYSINPLSLFLIKSFMPASYCKILGQMESITQDQQATESAAA